MKKTILFTLLILALVAVPALAVRQIYVFYEKTNPFDGYIRFTGKVDMAQVADGSTLKEHLSALLTKYPDAGYKLYPNGLLPDPEAVKYDQATEKLVSLDHGDITPIAQAVLDQAQKEADLNANMPSWAQVQDTINNISSLEDAKAYLLKLSRIVYWNTRNTPD